MSSGLASLGLGDVLTSSSLQPFTGGRGPECSSRAEHTFWFNIQAKEQGSQNQAIMYAYSYKQHLFSGYNNKSNRKQGLQ